MNRKAAHRLRQDFNHWTELVDRAAHAENEVEREQPALRAAELEQKWISTYLEDWNTMRDIYLAS
ncbi:hypothetical protein ACLMAL_12185 [Nocardia sp. CWNU-33]|uniref:hypothetical protein n=1 Tax=Nocardia sp. CWNU-33 TaxID=3392117 RepID=UPI00398EEF12